MHRLLLCLVTAIAATSVLAQGSGTVVYQEPFGPDAHPLYAFGGVIRFGPQAGDPWTSLLREGQLEIANTTDSSVLRYYFLDPERVPGWDGEGLAARVTVGGGFDELPSAGLLYGIDPTRTAFVALVRTGGDGYGIYVLDEDGYRAIATGTSPALVDGAMAELAIVPEAAWPRLLRGRRARLRGPAGARRWRRHRGAGRGHGPLPLRRLRARAAVAPTTASDGYSAPTSPSATGRRSR